MRFFILCVIFIYCVQAFGQQWIQKEPMPVEAPARNHPVTFAIGDYGYVVTGNTDFGPENDFYRYNTQTNEWEVLEDFPGANRGFSYGVAYNGKGYVGFGSRNQQVFNDMWSYDPVQQIWKKLASCPCSGRRHPAFSEINGKIYVGLGDNLNSNLNDFWAYDIQTDTWEQLPDFPSYNRHHPFYFSIGKDLFVGMGHGSEIINGWDVYRDFYKFDSETRIWTRMENFPGEARVAGTQFTYNGKGYILHGEGEDHQIMNEGEFWEYDPAEDSWKKLTSVPNGSRWAPGTFVVGNTVYTVGGSTFNYVNKKDLWSYEFEQVSSSSDTPKNSGISISPNPVSDCFVMNLPSFIWKSNESLRYKIFTLEGKLMFSGDTQSNMICAEFLHAGMYLLRIFNNETSQILPFVKM